MHAALYLATMVVMSLSCVPPNQNPGAYGNTSPGSYQSAPQAQQGATCEGACSHYLECKGTSDPTIFQGCVGECNNRQYDAGALAQYQTTDCANAIQIVEGTPNQGQGAPQKSADCQGCVWDGSSCIWMSSGNWGSGPYSGAATSCASSCCGR